MWGARGSAVSWLWNAGLDMEVERKPLHMQVGRWGVEMNAQVMRERAPAQKQKLEPEGVSCTNQVQLQGCLGRGRTEQSGGEGVGAGMRALKSAL